MPLDAEVLAVEDTRPIRTANSGSPTCPSDPRQDILQVFGSDAFRLLD